MSKILLIDGYFYMHRARSGFQLGDYNVVYNFLRSLKPLVDQFEPTRVYFTLEGHPKRRHDLLPTYKANRHLVAKPDATPEEVEAHQKKLKSDEDFHRQKNIIIDLLAKHFPVSVMRHPDFEGDDVVYNVIRNSSSAVEFVVVSADTDFIQLLQEFPNVKLYNPITKAFMGAPDYDYVMWKALRGDGSDNIPHVDGVNDQLAEQLLSDPEELKRLFEDKICAEQFSRNLLLIKFPVWSEEEHKQVESSAPQKDWDAVQKLFEEWAFKSMLKDPYWTKFKATFDALWG